MRLATGYWESQCLLAANQLGVFEALAHGPRTAEELAAELGLAARPTRLLLNACVGLGLLEKVARGFRNHPRSQLFLVPGTPAYLGDAVRYGRDMWEAWSRLTQALRDGRPAVPSETYTGDDPEKTRHFVHGMHNRALAIASALVPALDLSGRRRLLDVGGGPGTYSALLTRRYPELRCTVLDLPAVVALADEILESMDARGRVETVAGDYHTTPFPEGHDVILISGVFHRESGDSCRDLIERAHRALVPGGLLAVADVFTDPGGAAPLFAALFGLNMMLSAPDGGVHADTDVARWLEEAGFREVVRTPFPPPMPHRLVRGTR
jgi:SAM-dependent methyltransferase